MQLTKVQSLSKDYTDNDSEEMVLVMRSTHLSSPAAQLRWGNIEESDALSWLRGSVSSSLEEEFQVQRMSTALDLGDDKGLPPNSSAEHLIVRDLDMDRVGTSTEDDAKGRIVAHADWRYTPSYSGNIPNTPMGVNSADDKSSHPEGFNKELHEMLDNDIMTSIRTHFSGLPFFYLLGISTLTPSHLRKGIAKRLVEWIDPYVDHYSVPVVLYASPSGLHLYRSCGYEEYRDLDVAIDLNRWGVNETHRHVVMILWPKNEDRLPEAWQNWRKSHNASQPLKDTIS